MKNKTILLLLLLLAAAGSFLDTAYHNKFDIEELVAPVIVNVELDKAYKNGLVVIAEPNNRIFYFTTTTYEDEGTANTVIYSEIKNEYIQSLFVKCTDEKDIANAIDNITVFIGNKTYYYSQEIIQTWRYTEQDSGILLRLPVKPYTKSLIKPWINWYGDLNFALKEIIAFLTKPFGFKPTMIFLLFFLSLILSDTRKTKDFKDFIEKNKKNIEIISMLLLVFFAFLLRINGLTRHSSWIDELYSSTIAANPNLPFITTFKDPGNPPLFYVLLRIWHKIFGWSESSGRMLCVFIGILGIISLYCFVKMLCGRKYAFLAALLLTVSYTHIGFSNEIRAYILQMTLVPFAAQRFMILLNNNKSIKNHLIYIFSGAAIVNTHYYGVLLIAFNFLFFAVTNRKRLFIHKTVIFIMSNAIIALSVVPFFIVTAFQGALMNTGFNTWIPKPSQKDFFVFFMLLVISCFYPFIKQKSKIIKKILVHTNIIDYVVYACSFIFITAFLVSLKRPMLTWRYLSICLPFFIALFPVLVFSILNYGKFDAILRLMLCIVLLGFSYNFKDFGGGYNDVYKEAQEYIFSDINAHSFRSAEIGVWPSSYYNLGEIEKFTSDGHYNVVYINPTHQDEKSMQVILSDVKLKGDNILRIKTTNDKFIIKIIRSPY